MVFFRDPDVPLAVQQAELRKLVLKQIETHPGSFWMGDWERVHSPCRTTRCISGWAQFFTYGAVVYSGESPAEAGVQLLGLTEDEYYGDRDQESDISGLFYLEDDEALKEMRRLAGENRELS